LTRPAHIVVLRFSALGDVAMTVPVIRNLLHQYPGLTITYVSTSFVQPFFEGIERLEFLAADLKGKHKGVTGLYQLSKEIRKKKNTGAIADLHNVLRTKILRGFFSFSRVKKAVIDKGRKEKQEITRIDNKRLRPLKSTFQRYADVFEKLGYPVDLSIIQQEKNEPELVSTHDSPFTINDYTFAIGIAPFAKHLQKQYPPGKMKEVIRMLDAEGDKEIFLFGGKEDAAALQEWETEFKHVKNLAGKFSFSEELKKIASLDVMISMDSANMHLASLYHVPVISVWGGTHPFAGFYGWQQDPENAVQTDLYCRPCSVFGNRACYRGDLACLHSINPVTIYDRVSMLLYKKKY
jgi:ADP-heptose:LPS heptosyltransferase